MGLIIQKFGGTSVADIERLKHVARIIEKARDDGHSVVAVVSAMAGVTNQLVGYIHGAMEKTTNVVNKTHSISPIIRHHTSNSVPAAHSNEHLKQNVHHNKEALTHSFSKNPIMRTSSLAENDVVLAAGEQVTSGLLALCLQERGIPARSFLSWQIPISTNHNHTNADVESIDATTLHDFIEKGGVAVVAGFQGVCFDAYETDKKDVDDSLRQSSSSSIKQNDDAQEHFFTQQDKSIHTMRLTTLGRGGSDMTAVALAHALKADFCDIYTDVSGVYTADPRLVPNAKRINALTFEEMQLLADQGAKVLQSKCVRYAFEKNVRLRVFSSFDDHEAPRHGTEIVHDTKAHHGPLLQKTHDKNRLYEEEHALKTTACGIAHSFNDVKICLKILNQFSSKQFLCTGSHNENSAESSDLEKRHKHENALNSPLEDDISFHTFQSYLARRNIAIDGFVKSIMNDDSLHLSFYVTKADLVPTLDFFNTHQQKLGLHEISVDHDVVKISLVGQGLKENFLLKSKILKTLNQQSIFAELAAVNAMQMTFMAPANQARSLAQLLHDTFIANAS